MRDPDAIHTVVDLLPERVVYSTIRRNGVDFDVVIRALDSGAERTVYDGGGYVAEATATEAGCAVTLFSLQPCSTRVLLSDDHGTRAVTPAEEHALHVSVHLLDDGSLLLSSNSDREMTAVVRVAADGTRTTLVESDEHDLCPVLAPDARSMLVVSSVDGGHEIALHDIDGVLRRAVPLAARGCTAVWSADGRWLAVGLVAPTRPGDVLVVEAASGTVRTLMDGSEQLAPEVAAALVSPPATGCRLATGSRSRASSTRRPSRWTGSRDRSSSTCTVAQRPGPSRLQPGRAGHGRRRAHRPDADRPGLDRLWQAVVLP